jgi:probable rRNA maturation factor
VRASISNRQAEVRVKVRLLQSQLDRALKLLPRPLPRGVEALEIVLVDRATMAEVHGDFLGDPTETDVITFPYGEILVCPAVAYDASLALEATLDEEVLLYALHGILHLTGYDDTTPAARVEMHDVQAELLKKVLADA